MIKDSIQLTAKMARLSADMFRQTQTNEELNGILSDIAKVAAKGGYELNTSDMLVETSNRLVELGYTVKRGGRMNEIEYNITWE